MWHEWGYARPHLAWPLTFAMPPKLAWWRPSSPVQSVNEVEDPGGMAGTVWMEERLISLWKVVDCVEVDLLHPRRKWVVWLRWGYVIDVFVCLFVLFRLSCTSGIVCGLLVCFRWSVKIFWIMGVLKEQDGAVVDVFWLHPVSGPLSILKACLRL